MLTTFRNACRSLIKTPGFTIVAIATLGLGIGANTSMFSVVNTVMLKPLPYPDGEQLDQIHRVTPQSGSGALSVADYRDLQTIATRYGQIAASIKGDVSVSSPGQPAEFAPALRVSANFFSTLGILPVLGRDFQAREETLGNHHVVVISHRCWVQRYASDPGVVGRTVRIDGEPHEIIGVMPATFNDWRHLGWVDFFRPLGLTAQELADRHTPLLEPIGRRSPTLNLAAAQELVAGTGRRLAVEFPELNAGTTWRLVPFDEIRLGETGGVALTMLIGLSGFVLLIACSNLADLLLARTMARTRELAVRSALGATRLQLLVPLFAETLLLSLLGGACALLIANWFADWVRIRSAGDNGEFVALSLNWTVFSWAFYSSLATTLLFAIAPALFALRLDLNTSLKSGGRSATTGRGHRRFRQCLIVGQFALVLILLTGAALFVRGLNDLNNRRQGWESNHLVTGTILLPSARYNEADKMTAFQRLALNRISALPGVESASLSWAQPFFNWHDTRKLLVEGHAIPEPGREPGAVVNGVSPGYFSAVRTPLLSGRTFTENDTARSTRVLVINEAMARGLFAGENPIGRRLAPAGTASSDWGEIVGIVRDVASIFPEPSPTSYQLYQPLAQEPRPYNELAVRTAGIEPAVFVASLRRLMQELDPDLPVRNLKPADQRIARANYQLAVLRDMLSAIAVLGLGLATLGIYGVISRTMAQRSGEFAIRLALGASVRQITSLVLKNGITLAALGSAIGLAGAVGIGRLLAAGFPGMRLEGPSVILGSTVFLITVALLACYLPARRAARIDPAALLRAD